MTSHVDPVLHRTWVSQGYICEHAKVPYVWPEPVKNVHEAESAVRLANAVQYVQYGRYSASPTVPS